MASSRTILDAVHHISDHSIFFLPARSNNLDLKTLSTAPPCHRAVLQRNGLVAKIYAAVTFIDYHNGVGRRMTWGTHDGADGSTTTRREVMSLSGRQEVWRSALTYAGLLSNRDATLALPDTVDEATPWPLLTLSQYQTYVKQAAARAACAAINSSSFCVPILSMQEFLYKRHDLEVSVAVLWMPFYPRSLRQWAAGFERVRKPIPEALLFALLHHLTVAQLTVRSGDTMAGRTEAAVVASKELGNTPTAAAAAASTLHLDAVLVHENEGEKEGQGGDWSEEPTFVLSASAMDEEHNSSCGGTSHECRGLAEPTEGTTQHNTSVPRASSPSSPTCTEPSPQVSLYTPPEECNPRLYPSLVSGTGKRAVWGLGVILYLLATGHATTQTAQQQQPQQQSSGLRVSSDSPRGSPSPRHAPLTPSPRRTRVVEEVPFNASAMTPDAVWKRLRRDLERRGYEGPLITVAAQLLSLDPLTRPSLTTVDRMLQDLHRPTPIHRFPFALGGYDLLRLPNPSAAVELNPGARRYTLAEVCVLCKKPRHATTVCSKGGDHQTSGVTSPSWSDETALLPGVGTASDATYITFLYPLCGAGNGRQRRKQAAHALQNANASMSVVVSANVSGNNGAAAAPDVVPLHCGFLLQVFGGFAVYDRTAVQNAKKQTVYKVTVREVLIPYPSHGLRRSELSLVKTTLEFGGGLPWPSCCTEVLQRGGRVSRHVPFALIGAHHDVEWFGWVLPGERFAMPNGSHWTAPLDGAFVFWFGPDLQPTDRDRYFAVTSARAATLRSKVSRTVLPDSLFRQHIGDENHVSTLLLRSSVASSISRSESQVGPTASGRPTSSTPRSPGASTVRRRSIQSVTDITLPAATREIVEDAEGDDLHDGDTVMQGSALSRPSSRPGSSTDGAVTPRMPASATGRRRRSSAGRPRRSPSCQVSVVAAHTASAISHGTDQTTAQRRSRQSSVIAAAPATEVGKASTPSATPSAVEAAPAAAMGAKAKRGKTVAPLTPPPMSPSTASTGATNNKHNSTPPPTTKDAAQDSYVTLSAATSPQCRTPTAHGRITSRESTQPPSHRDTSATTTQALSPLPVNSATPMRSPRVSSAEAKKRKSRVMLAAEAPHTSAAAAAVDRADAVHCGLSPLQGEKERPTSRCTGRGGEKAAHSVARKLSPRPSRRPTSPRTSAPNSARQQQPPSQQQQQMTLSGLATPTFATPKLAPLSHAVSALGTLRVCGAWLPADVIDAAFQGLTFWVFSTGEHGYMHPPIKMSAHMGYGLRAPPGAMYLSFLSNQVPLFRRNHPRLDVAVFSPLLPHHGFACYSAEGRLLGVLALRCSLKDDADILHGEFTLNTHVQEACHGSQVSTRAIYASYLAGSVGDEKAMLGNQTGERQYNKNHQHQQKKNSPSKATNYNDSEANRDGEGMINQLLHSPSFNQTGFDSHALWNTPSEVQTLTFTSARHLVGDFTPNEKDGFALEKESTPVLPACWVGFDGTSGSLMFADVGQSAWVPYAIGA